MSEIVWLRVLDTSGSWHPCAKGDPGATAFVKAALPSGHEGLGVLKQLHATLDAIDHHIQEHSFSLALGLVSQGRHSIREAIAALGRVQPVAFDAVANARKQAEASLGTLDRALQQRVERKMAEATPPAPQPALALIEELMGVLEDAIGHIPMHRDEMTWLARARTVLASAKRFKGE